jgi:hypothetical protein
MELTPPSDGHVTTLWLGNITDEILEQDIGDAVYGYGHILNIHIARAGRSITSQLKTLTHKRRYN